MNSVNKSTANEKCSRIYILYIVFKIGNRKLSTNKITRLPQLMSTNVRNCLCVCVLCCYLIKTITNTNVNCHKFGLTFELESENEIRNGKTARNVRKVREELKHTSINAIYLWMSTQARLTIYHIVFLSDDIYTYKSCISIVPNSINNFVLISC